MSSASHRKGGGDRSIVEGEYDFTFEDFRRIAAMLHADAGISLPENKVTLVYSRLAKRLRATGIESFREYCAHIAAADGVEERKKMLAALTTNVTRFFREPHHFEHLKAHVLPKLIQRARGGGRVRIWSAGCSSGQEPYSIGLTLLSMMPDAPDYDVRVLASDIDPNVLNDARAGVYRSELCTEIPRELRTKWMRRTGDLWSMGDELRSLIAFRELNLIGEWPMHRPFDVIFCRNVAIYFEEDTQVKIWRRFQSILVPGGRLYIGHSERLSGTGDSFETDGLTTYRLREEVRR
jgi:chemotaxis protein methyltransferase CheR